MGLLDNPQDAALMQLGLGLLQAGGPSRMPISLGQAIGSAGSDAMQAYRQAQNDQQMRQMRDIQIKQQQSQMDEMTRRNAALKTFRDQLPPQLQGQFDIDPQGFLKQLQKQEEEYTLTPGAVRYRGSQKLAEAPQEPKLPSAVQEYQFAVNQGYKGSFADFQREMKQAGATTIQNFHPPIAAVNPVTGKTELVQFGNKGDVRPTGFKPALDAKPPTEAETKAGFYAGNMRAASAVLKRLEKEGMDMSKLGNQVDTAAASGMTNMVSSPRAQQARQAQNQWAEQMLRMQTGAAATQDEITRTVATYFPRPGDSADVVRQKEEMRDQAEKGVFAAAGRAQGRVEQPKTVVRSGTYGGKKVVEYSDGSVEYAD